MAHLELTDARVAQLNEAEKNALDILNGCLRGDYEVDDKVQVAIKTANMVTKNRVTVTARDGLHLHAASFIADEKQMKKYVAATFPEVRKLIGK